MPDTLPPPYRRPAPIPAAERTQPATPEEMSRVWWRCVEIIREDARKRGVLPPANPAA